MTSEVKQAASCDIFVVCYILIEGRNNLFLTGTVYLFHVDNQVGTILCNYDQFSHTL